ncbi:MAG: SDR family oxidoreductase [Ferruginibacter sp.]
MKILITGANGLLGQHLIKLLIDDGAYNIIATGKGNNRITFPVNDRFQYHTLDITDEKAVDEFIQQYQPDTIVHSAAMTQADECEQNQTNCWNINVTATNFLISTAKKINAHFIYISTCFVFDGFNGPYKETDATGPVNYYGTSKLAAEKAVLENLPGSCIVRTILVYGNKWLLHRSNIVSWVKDNLEKQQKIKVVSDQWRTPTYVDDLAAGVLLAIMKNAKGIYHISGEEMMTPYDMAIAVADHCNLDKTLIEKVNADTFTQPAKRPAITGFIIDKAKKDLGYQPVNFAEGLKLMLNKP